MQDLRIKVGERVGSVSALLMVPNEARLLYILAHGAGAGMSHTFLETLAQALAEHRIATLRYQFPYMEGGRRRPDPPAVLQATVRAALDAAHQTVPELPFLAGGKSMGGRMTSQLLAQGKLGYRGKLLGLAFLGFPLHAPGKPGRVRGEHLKRVPVPMFFLQGTRDSLADLDLLIPLCDEIGARATLHPVAGGDHSFKVLKRSGRSQEEVFEELTGSLVEWSEGLLWWASG